MSSFLNGYFLSVNCADRISFREIPLLTLRYLFGMRKSVQNAHTRGSLVKILQIFSLPYRSELNEMKCRLWITYLFAWLNVLFWEFILSTIFLRKYRYGVGTSNFDKLSNIGCLIQTFVIASKSKIFSVVLEMLIAFCQCWLCSAQKCLYLRDKICFFIK
jgi:hypothetical protein